MLYILVFIIIFNYIIFYFLIKYSKKKIFPNKIILRDFMIVWAHGVFSSITHFYTNPPLTCLVICNLISRECYVHAVKIFNHLTSLPSVDCVQSRFPCYRSFSHFCMVNPLHCRLSSSLQRCFPNKIRSTLSPKFDKIYKSTILFDYSYIKALIFYYKHQNFYAYLSFDLYRIFQIPAFHLIFKLISDRLLKKIVSNLKVRK